VQTPDTQSPAEKPQATKVATARAPGFSTVSTFTGPVSATSARSTGPYGQAPSGATKLSPNDLGVLAQDQGNTNACGTTSLANVMTHWGMPRTHEQIDESIRPFNLFTAPDKLVEYARDNGMRAELKADASLDDLARMVDQGAPPIVLMDPDKDDNANLHYVTVTGYTRDASGKLSELVIADSAGGYRYTMPVEEFQKKWDNLKLGGVGTGLNNVMITAVPRDGRMVTGGDGVQRRASDIALPRTSFWSNLKSGFARTIASAITSGANLASKVGDFFGKLWKGLFG
jgi:hypothetical protein